ncbi:hypothetical protein CEUSTIGMA_g1181.t1 [Chlamydomonas eustigma]|uniref:Rhamnogalacturonase A/B/Epimerase-like pectate lyase domain-containing protein n=1 Tax=Chlamydomonas eustigma TaxID=1157962 RepID=A0A250WSC0_9CHLO|nr:hypothetical protein CEUSTIGMA_g1181.t1 [Chlamydomonas eustigma]|eukprot:GAX73728.1 hypothetical protein CEUSTIGMA_g1181.t1 [Chlamydomonas eustigma]
MRVCTIFVLAAFLSAGSSSTHFQDVFEASEAGQSSINSEALYKRIKRRIFLGQAPALLPPPPSQAVVSTYPIMVPGFAFTSSLWGAHGELWEPTGRLLDYSYAGYMANEAPIPINQTIAADVVQFGAVGDGVTDCTQAFKAAIAAVSSGVIYVPPGTYLITTQLTISNSGVVLRGAGAGVSTIYINNSLTDVFGQLWSGHGKDTNISAQSDWKDGPGMIRFAGPGSADLAGVGHVQIGAQDPISNATLLTAITGHALRGSVKVMVASTKALKPNQWVTITIGDVNGTLVKDLYNNVNVTNMCKVTGQPAYCINDLRVMRFHSRIYAVHTNYIVLERPLPFNISLEWVPEVHAFVPGIQQCGIEALTIQFQWKQYAGHLLEDGFNGIEFAGAANCWARDLIISNSDNHLFMWLSSFITVNNVTVTSLLGSRKGGCFYLTLS